ncbi:MAG: hypothetical protein AAFP77_19645 [Bacteroidota bacterium]
MPYMIIALRDGDANKALPILSADDNDLMALFDTEEQAQEFCRTNMLCQHSENFIINTDGGDVTFR